MLSDVLYRVGNWFGYRALKAAIRAARAGRRRSYLANRAWAAAAIIAYWLAVKVRRGARALSREYY